MLLTGLLLMVASNFRNRWKKSQKKTWMIFWRGFARCARKKDRTLWVYKSSSMKSIWESPLIVSLAAAQQTVFLHLWLPAFTGTNKAVEHLQKTSEKRATLLAYWSQETVRNQLPMSTWRNFDSVELGRAESKNPNLEPAQLQRTT